jgi:hypothetical protein
MKILLGVVAVVVIFIITVTRIGAALVRMFDLSDGQTMVAGTVGSFVLLLLVALILNLIERFTK